MPEKSKHNAEKHFLDLYGGDLEAAISALKAFKQNAAPHHRKITADTPVLVNVEKISKQFKLGKQKVQALKDVSINIHEGEFVALTGASGSGKSTLMHLIGGLDKPSEGKIVIGGQDISKLSDRKLAMFRNKTVGFVFQFFYLQPFLSLQTNLEVPSMFARIKPPMRSKKAIELAEKVGLSERLRHRPKELSGGQMQRAAIARALMNGPKLLLADEPTGNLDSENGQAIIDLFEEVRKTFGTTVIIVTHDPKIAARTDREIVLKDGRVDS